MIKIIQIETKREVDEYPDLSWLGEYSNTPDWELAKRGGCFYRHNARRNEYKWFYPTNTLDEIIKWYREHGYSRGNADYFARKQCRQDFERMEAYNNNEWCMIGIFAEATILIYSKKDSYGIFQKIKSGGLWGIESDSEEEYKRSIEDEELNNLSGILTEMVVKKADIKKAMKEVSREKSYI